MRLFSNLYIMVLECMSICIILYALQYWSLWIPVCQHTDVTYHGRWYPCGVFYYSYSYILPKTRGPNRMTCQPPAAIPHTDGLPSHQKRRSSSLYPLSPAHRYYLMTPWTTYMISWVCCVSWRPPGLPRRGLASVGRSCGDGSWHIAPPPFNHGWRQCWGLVTLWRHAFLFTCPQSVVTFLFC